jgi:hypothetical protein
MLFPDVRNDYIKTTNKIFWEICGGQSGSGTLAFLRELDPPRRCKILAIGNVLNKPLHLTCAFLLHGATTVECHDP